jgi:hypothetical protein
MPFESVNFKEKIMRKRHSIIAAIGMLSLFLLSGCANDGDGQLELKEPKKELSEMPPGIIWDASDPGKIMEVPTESDSK